MNNLDNNPNIDSILKQNQISKSNHVTPINKEIILDPNKSIMSKTDSKGIIEFANDYFMEISGYEEFELMGQPHNVIRHPDMPKLIFKIMWQELKKGNSIFALVKNLAKDGRYYWVLVNFEIKYNEEGEITSYYARRKAAPRKAIFEIEKLYKKLRDIEVNQNVNVAYRYFVGLLEEQNISYEDYIANIMEVEKNVITAYFQDDTKEVKKKGFLGRLFS